MKDMLDDPGQDRMLVDKVLHRMVSMDNHLELQEICPISIINMDTWEWAQGVGLYGMFKHWKLSGDEKLLDFLLSWFDRTIANGLPARNINTTCPMLVLTYLYEQTRRPDYLDLCLDWADSVMHRFPRTEEGGLQHCVSGQDNPGELWDDTLFMTVLFLARMGILTGNRVYLDEVVHQFLVHAKFLTDPKTGLWFHGWTFEGRHHFAKARWARGNCWFTIVVPELLDMLPILDRGVRRFLVESLQAQVAALAGLQKPGGLWPTLLDEPNTYGETSATAGFVYGILKGIRLGILPETYRRTAIRGAAAAIRMIKEDGTVDSVSYGTGMGRDLQFYRDIPIVPMTYGQALVLMMLDEVSQAKSSAL